LGDEHVQAAGADPAHNTLLDVVAEMVRTFIGYRLLLISTHIFWFYYTMVSFLVIAALSFGASLVVPVTFTAGAAVSGNSVLVANPNAATADGPSAVVLTFTAKDCQNNVVPGLGVSFTASGTGSAFGAASATNNTNGQVTTTLASTVAQNKISPAPFFQVHIRWCSSIVHLATFSRALLLLCCQSFCFQRNIRLLVA
jgi:hypothetical protein